MRTVFNYIITIHNKEDLIGDVLNAVIKCCNVNSFVYPVLDGCTDRSEEIIDKFIQQNSSVKIIKIHTPDVHETRSINAGLMHAHQNEHGFNIILQDDVIIEDYNIEEKIKYIYKWSKRPLGMVSFRMGANFKKNWLTNNENTPFSNFVENIYGHGTSGVKVLLLGQFTYRAFPFKSPICIPCEMIDRFGFFEDEISPHTYDDLEYSLRLIKEGFVNGVFALKFRSKKKWGGTRRIEQNVIGVQNKNINFIRSRYANLDNEKQIYGVDMKTYNTHYFSIWNLSTGNIFSLIKHSLHSIIHLPKLLFKRVIKYGN